MREYESAYSNVGMALVIRQFQQDQDNWLYQYYKSCKATTTDNKLSYRQHVHCPRYYDSITCTGNLWLLFTCIIGVTVLCTQTPAHKVASMTIEPNPTPCINRISSLHFRASGKSSKMHTAICNQGIDR